VPAPTPPAEAEEERETSQEGPAPREQRQASDNPYVSITTLVTRDSEKFLGGREAHGRRVDGSVLCTARLASCCLE
jgi:hypothetical protein